MSTKNDYHKNVMCNVCGKVMRDDHLKSHMSSKHADTLKLKEAIEIHGSQSTQSCTENAESGKEQSVHGECKDHVKALETAVAADSANDDDDACLKFQLLQNNEAHKNNVNLGRKISKVLNEGVVFEESLTKQQKFCLELFRAQQPATDVANAKLRQWQTQLLDVIDQEQMNDRMIIWVMGDRKSVV